MMYLGFTMSSLRAGRLESGVRGLINPQLMLLPLVKSENITIEHLVLKNVKIINNKAQGSDFSSAIYVPPLKNFNPQNKHLNVFVQIQIS